MTAERPPGPAFLAHKLRSDRLVAVVQRSSQLARLKTISFAELVKLPLILREDGSKTRQLLLAEAARRDLALSTTIEIESREAAREAAAEGLGLAIMSQGELVPECPLVPLYPDAVSVARLLQQHL